MAINTSELNKSLKHVREWIQSIAASEEGALPDDVDGVMTWSSAEYGSLTIWGDLLQGCRQGLASLYRVVNGKQSEHLSEREVEEALRDATLKTLDSKNVFPNTSFDNRLQTNIQILKDRLTAAPADWDVYVGVEGFEFHPSCFVFGKVRFLAGEKSTLLYLRREMARVLMGSANTLEGKMLFRRHSRKTLEEHYAGKVIAHLRVQAVDKEAAQALAEKELKLTLDVLNFYTSFVHPRGTRVRVHLPGEAQFMAHTLTVPFTGNTGNRSFTLSMGLGGPIDLFHARALSGRLAVRSGAVEASRLLALPERTALQERFVAALRFAGRACVNETREEAFLGFAIAIESLLGDTESQGEITYKLAARCAHLLSDNTQGRKQIRDNLKKLYGVRSKIVHRGNIDLTDLQLGQIRGYARYALRIALTHQELRSLTTDSELLDWFEDKILG